MLNDVYIIDGVRTAIGAFGKSLKNISAIDLAATVIRILIKKHNIKNTDLDEVILGNAVSAGIGQNPARQALVRAGISTTVPGFTVNKVCGSGLKAVVLAAQAIMCDDADLIIAGGTENTSQCPYLISRNSETPEDKIDSLINDGLWCNMYGDHMVKIAEYTAEKYNITREEQDKYALRSHEKAVKAIKDGVFSNEIIPVETAEGNIFDIDEKPRENLTLERLLGLRPAMKRDGTITAGNSPAPADGAAGLIVASENGVKNRGLKPAARILGYTSVAVDPELAFTAASEAVKKCLKICSLDIREIDLFELNEAFAVQSVLTNKLLDLDDEKVNIFGGTIALGHPLGASGARGLTSLINALRISGEKTGLTAVCLGGGCAVALAITLVD